MAGTLGRCRLSPGAEFAGARESSGVAGVTNMRVAADDRGRLGCGISDPSRTLRSSGATVFQSRPLRAVCPCQTSLTARTIPMRILLVDDDTSPARLADSVVPDGSRCQVTCVDDSRAALDCLKTARFDLLISDLRVPEIDGVALLQEVCTQYPNLPSIVITSFGNQGMALEALQAGAHSYVPRQYVRQTLAATVETVLNATAEQREEEELLCSVMRHDVTLSLPSDRTRIAPTVRYLQKIAGAMGLVDRARRVHFGVAIEEALSNAVVHGNLEVSSELREQDDDAWTRTIEQRTHQPPWKSRRVTVRAELTPLVGTFTVSDEGPGFDVTSLPDATDPENLLRPHGRGIMLMTAFLDSVQFNDRGNSVQLQILANPDRFSEDQQLSRNAHQPSLC